MYHIWERIVALIFSEMSEFCEIQCGKGINDWNK